MEDKTIIQLAGFAILGIIAVLAVIYDRPYAAMGIGAVALLVFPSPITEKIVEMLPLGNLLTKKE